MSKDRTDRLQRTEQELVEFSRGAHAGARSVLQRKRFRNACKDIAQDATIDYINSDLQARKPFSLGYSFGKKRAIDEVRRSINRPIAIGGDEPFIDPAIEDGNSLQENSSLTYYLKEVLALPPQDAFLIINEWLTGFVSRAAVLGYMKGRKISQENARQHLTLARKKLKERLLQSDSI